MRRQAEASRACTRAGLILLCALLCLQGCATNYTGKYRFSHSSAEEKHEVYQTNFDETKRTHESAPAPPAISSPESEESAHTAAKAASIESIFKSPVPAMLAATIPLWRIHPILGATVTIVVIAIDEPTRTYLMDLAFGS